MLALVEAGWSRDDAYRTVQGAASAAWDDGASFRACLEADERVRDTLGERDIAELFDPQRYLSNLGGVFDALEKLPVQEVPAAEGRPS